MRTDTYQKRFYREYTRSKDLVYTHISAKETDLQILTNKKLDKAFVEERIRFLRWDIENYITYDSRFLNSLKPIEVEKSAPEIIKEMSDKSKLVNVGPMNTVAGAIAEFLGRDLVKKGYKDVIIENGGDIFINTSKIRDFSLYAGKSKLWNKLKLKIKPKDSPIGVCTSSGTLGQASNFGAADSVVVLSKSTMLADAVASAAANRINSKEDFQKALDFASKIRGVSGIVIILKNELVSWGKVEFSK